MTKVSAALPFVIPRCCDFIGFSREVLELQTNLSSRLSRPAVEPERSAVEVPALSEVEGDLLFLSVHPR
jgi:hypothetical protein